jgi:hypothetical protein
LAGRTATGEHTGEFYLIPNNKVWENPIIKVDYNRNAYQKILCIIYYRADRYKISWDEYLICVTTYLDELLLMRTAKNV